MPDWTAPASAAALAPSLTGPSPVTDRVGAVDWPVSDTAVPDTAGWLACSEATEQDDAALVTSITAWRKVTSWAQAQELAAVAELARRRRVAEAMEAGGQDCDRAADAGDRGPVAERVLTWTTPARLTHTVTSGPYPA